MIRTTVFSIGLILLILLGCKNNSNDPRPDHVVGKTEQSSEANELPSSESSPSLNQSDSQSDPHTDTAPISDDDQSISENKNRLSPGQDRYPDHPTTTLEHLIGRIEYDQVALENFRRNVLPSVDPQHRDEVEQLVSDTLAALIESNTSATWIQLLNRFEELDSKFEEAEHPLSNDPLWIACRGIVIGSQGQTLGAFSLLQNAINRLPQSHYRHQTQVLIYRQYFRYYPIHLKAKAAEPVSEFGTIALDWFQSKFEVPFVHHRYVVEDISFFFNLASGLNLDDTLNRFNQGFIQVIDLPTWLRYTIRGYFLTLTNRKHIRWERGTFYVYGPSDTRNSLLSAKEFFLNAHKIYPMAPEPAIELMILGKLLADEAEQIEWFEKTMVAQPDHLYAFKKRLEALSPRFGGSVEQMLDFTRNFVEGTSYETMAPILSLMCHQMIIDTVHANDEQRIAYLEDPQTIRNLIQVVDQFYKSSNRKVLDDRIVPDSYFLTLKAIWSVELEEYDEVDETMWSLADQFDADARRQLGANATTFNVFRARPYAMISEFETEARELASLLGDSADQRSENAQAIIKLAEEVLTENSHPLGSLFFQQALQLVKLELDYQHGFEIEIPFDPDLILWRSDDIDRVLFDSENSIIVDNRQNLPPFKLESIGYLPGNKSIEFEIEFLTDDSFSRGSLAPWVSVIIGDYSPRSKIAIGLKLINPGDREIPDGRQWGAVRFGDTSNPGLGHYYEVAVLTGINKVRINVFDRYIEFFLNDDFVFRTGSFRLERAADYFGLVQSSANLGAGMTRISNIRLQRLMGERPPFDVNPKALVDYFQDQIETSDENRWNHFWLGQALHQMSQWEPAIDQYQRAMDLGMPVGIIGFYIGDIFERQNDLPQALDWYRRAADKKFIDFTRLPNTETRSGFSNPQNWAAFRVAWIESTSPDQQVRDNFDLDLFVTPMLPQHLHWMNDLWHAQHAALKGEFEDAAKLALKTLSRCSSEQERRIIPIIQSYRKGELYISEDGNPPIYQIANPTFPFFRHYHDYLTIDEKRRF